MEKYLGCVISIVEQGYFHKPFLFLQYVIWHVYIHINVYIYINVRGHSLLQIGPKLIPRKISCISQNFTRVCAKKIQSFIHFHVCFQLQTNFNHDFNENDYIKLFDGNSTDKAYLMADCLGTKQGVHTVKYKAQLFINQI